MYCFLSWRFIGECYICIFCIFFIPFLRVNKISSKLSDLSRPQKPMASQNMMYVCMILPLIILQQRENIKAPLPKQFTVYLPKKTTGFWVNFMKFLKWKEITLSGNYRKDRAFVATLCFLIYFMACTTICFCCVQTFYPQPHLLIVVIFCSKSYKCSY